MTDQSPEPVVVVPREPKPEMLAAFWRQKNTGSQEPGQTGDDRSDYAAYRAMIAAAPASPDPLLEEAGERMQQMIGYMVHDDGCTTNRFPGADVCSCGMRGALSEARAFLAKLGRA